MKHPKKFTCSCPFAKENGVICKHMVATCCYVNPSYIEDFEDVERGIIDELAECWLELETYRRRDI